MPQESDSNLKSVLSSKIKIGVLAGGTSSERKISLRSGRAVTKALKSAGARTIFLDPADRIKFSKRLKNIDLAFIALHGHGGEDGVMQAFLEKRGIPYIGSDAASSRKAFDKAISKRIFVKTGIPTAPFAVASAKNWRRVIQSFGMPCFVKPLREGSSIGAFAVEDLEKMAVKLRRTIQAFGDLLVEKKIEGRELTVGVLGSRALPVIEMRPKGAFYDYKSKYTKGMTEYIVPAKISRALSAKLQKIALKTHRALKLRDFSRVDMMVDVQGHVYVLEANSIPGFTELSLLPKAAKAAGISFKNLCLRLAGWAYARGKKTLR